MYHLVSLWFVTTLFFVSSITSAQSQAPKDEGLGDTGIEVHGHWMIEVFEPDGTLASVHQFENALQQPQGAGSLATILYGGQSVGGWVVELSNTDLSKRICDTSGSQVPCVLCQAGVTWDDPTHANDLSVTVPSGTPEIVMSGSIIADYDGAIQFVDTRVKRCASSDSPDSCKTLSGQTISIFTTHENSPEIPVQTGQQVQVTVTLSFS